MATPDQFSFEPCQSLRQRTLISSIGGFSQPAAKQIRSLQELLRAIQPLLLRLYDGSGLHEEEALGEGVSYKVFRCRDTRSQKVVAVKQVKLPSSTSDFESFQGRVSCVLKDIEVMHHDPLAEHPNILNLLGYGWQLQRGSIPFLVTECATLGTLRQYLKAVPMSARQQQKFCRHVALGLHELHMSGIAHGDIKLDNVLVMLESPLGAATTPDVDEDEQNLMPVAKISDFGHSLLLSDEQGGDRDQRYHGTTAYNAPELFSGDHSQQRNWSSTDFRRCDVWAFGLLCLEALSNGTPYYGDQRVRDGLSRSSAGSGSRTLVSSGDSQYDILAVLRPWICEIALILAKRLHSRFTSMNFIRTFRLCLVHDHAERAYDVSSLPILAYGVNQEVPQVKPRLNESTEKLGQWLFESFRPRQIAEIPHIAKSQIFLDSQRLAVTQSSSAARAAFQAGLAHATGFGTPKNQAQFLASMKSSSEKGHPTSTAFLPFFEETFCQDDLDHPKAYSQILVSAFKQSLELSKQQEIRRETYRLSRHIEHPPALNRPTPNHNDGGKDPSTEPVILVFARSGDALKVLSILEDGADPAALGKDGTNVLHWLFMFPIDKMREIGQKVCQREARYGLINQIATGCRVLDSQLPLELRGTPLSYAVATASQEAVKVLLELGADPNFVTGQSSRHYSPLWLATSLHLHGLLAPMLSVTELRDPTPGESTVTILHTLSESSPLERELIHGSNTLAACRETVRVLAASSEALRISMLSKPEEMMVPALEAAISAADITVANTILNMFQDFIHGEVSAALQLGRIAILRTALHTSCRDIYDKDTGFGLISFALSQGSDVNATSPHYQNSRPIFVTIEHQREDLFNFLLGHGEADLTARDNKGQCILHFFAIHGFFQSLPLKKILDMDISLDTVNSQGASPLHYAARNGRLGQTLLLLDHGANALHADSSGHKALHHAVMSKQLNIVTAILPFETNINAKDREGMTALAIAVKAGLYDIVRRLLDSGADASVANGIGKSPLHFAAEAHRSMIIELLLSSQSQEQGLGLLWAQTNSRQSPLDLAIESLVSESDDRAACDVLLDAGADPTKSLLMASRKSNAWLVRYILKYRPNLSYCNADEETGCTSALTAATLLGEEDIVRLLLEAGADCNALDGNGNNAIHCAVMGQKWKLLDVFISLACPIPALNGPNAKGATPIDLALESGPLGSKRLSIGLCYQLLSAGARSPSRPWPKWFKKHDLEFLRSLDNMSAYFDPVTASQKHIAFAKEFIREGIHSKGDASGSADLTSLHIWATLPAICKLSRWGSTQTFAITKATACLLESGADGLATDNAGRTALSRAIHANNVVMCGALLTQYTLVIDGLATNLSGREETITDRKIIPNLYKKDVQACWLDVITNSKLNMIDVFITSKIDLDMTTMEPILMDLFIHALRDNIRPVLAEFTRSDQLELEFDSEHEPEETAPISPPRHKKILRRLIGLMRSSSVEEVQVPINYPIQEAEEQALGFQKPRECLQRFWRNDIVEADYSKIKILIPPSKQTILATMIIENGLLQSIERISKLLLDALPSHLVGPDSSTVSEHAAVRKSTILVASISDMVASSLTNIWSTNFKDISIGLRQLLLAQSNIQLNHIAGLPRPRELVSLRAGLDLLDIRVNAFINFIQGIARDASPVLAMYYGFDGISLLQNLRESPFLWMRNLALDKVTPPSNTDVYFMVEPEVERIFSEIVTISLVTRKKTANILEQSWMYALSAVEIATLNKLKFPYKALHKLRTASSLPRSFEAKFSTPRPVSDVKVLAPVGQWWLIKTDEGSIGLVPAENLSLAQAPLLEFGDTSPTIFPFFGKAKYVYIDAFGKSSTLPNEEVCLAYKRGLTGNWWARTEDGKLYRLSSYHVEGVQRHPTGAWKQFPAE